MEAIQPPKNAESPTNEDRCGTLAKKKRVAVAKNGNHSKERDNRENSTQEEIPQGNKQIKKSTQTKRSGTQHEQHQTNTTGGGHL